MPKFVTGNALNYELESIFNEAHEELTLISPYIRLHYRFKQSLQSKPNTDKLKITVVFGKNEENPAKSIPKEEIDFFKEFPNIEIRYESRLHAKYYANEKKALITSMNLYDFSQDNNIEAGVSTSTSFLQSLTNSITDSLDKEAYEYFNKVIGTSTLLYKKEPEYEKSLMGIISKYKSSRLLVDVTQDFFGAILTKPIVQDNKKFARPEITTGYCIRTGTTIPFNPEKPMSYQAYQSWAQYENFDYPENFCHLTGRKSFGKTTMRNPILN